jgi:hypothetical protein
VVDYSVLVVAVVTLYGGVGCGGGGGGGGGGWRKQREREDSERVAEDGSG